MKIDIQAERHLGRRLRIKASSQELGQPPVQNPEFLVLFGECPIGS